VVLLPLVMMADSAIRDFLAALTSAPFDMLTSDGRVRGHSCAYLFRPTHSMRSRSVRRSRNPTGLKARG